jgi:hypothetical protein
MLITPKIKKIISEASKIALDYEKLTGRKLGITGEVGEVLACDKLKLQLSTDNLSAGYDAMDNKGKKYQIKTRRLERGKGRLGHFSKHKFDYAVLVLLDEDYKISKLYHTDYKKLEPLLNKQKKRNPTFTNFVKIAEELKSKKREAV